jgi:hypothetical protein
MTARFIDRRALGLLAGAAALLPRGARAQQVPCPSTPGDIVGLVLDGTGAPDGTVLVFGQAFRAGDLPREASLAARTTEGRALPVQTDVSTRHPDGSARFAVVSLATPALRNGSLQGVMLARGAPAAGAPIDAAAGLAARRAIVEVAPETGGAPWRADLVALARSAAGARPWQAGPLAAQLRITAPVPQAACGTQSMRLVADLSLRADGSFWVDAWLRNDIAMRPGGGAAAYTLRIELDGREVLRTSAPVRQVQYTGWGRLVGVGAGGAQPALPPLLRPDPSYLNATGATAHYDLSIGVAPALLNEVARLVAAPDWSVPLSPRGIVQYMPTTGARPDIGPTTLWQAIWLVTGDRRAALLSVGQAEASGAVPWHFWDNEGGAQGRGGWMDVARWPGLWTDPRGGVPPRMLANRISDASGWQADTAHQPDLSFVPYLLTGRRALLDNLLAHGAGIVVRIWPAARAEARAYPAVRDMNLANLGQVRGYAWSLRTVDNAAWVAPDDDPNAAYLRRVIAANWGWLVAQIPRWTREQGEAHGWIPGEAGDGTAMATWNQDYLATSVAAAARRGSADARTLLAWMENFLVGRFMAEDRGFAPIDGIAYALAIRERPGDGPPLTTWAQIGATMRLRNISNEGNWGKIDRTYRLLALAALASLIDITGTDGAKRAYAWLSAQAVPPSLPQELQRECAWNITPRGEYRSPGQAPRCR